MSVPRVFPIREITIDVNDPEVIDTVYDVLRTELSKSKANRLANSVLAELRRYSDELQEDNDYA